MATEQTLDTVNNVNIKNTGEMSGWSSGHRLVEAAQHSTRSDRVAELAYDNQVALQARQQNLALDQDTAMRNISNMFLGALANKFIHMDPSEAISTSQAFKGSSDASILSILSGLSGGQVAAKVAQSTPPTSASDTGVAGLMTMMNTLNQQNYSNNTTNASLAATMASISSILNKIAYNTPPS